MNYERRAGPRTLSANELERLRNFNKWQTTTGVEEWRAWADRLLLERPQLMSDMCKHAAISVLDFNDRGLRLEDMVKFLINFDDSYHALYRHGKPPVYDFRTLHRTHFKQNQLAYLDVELEDMYEAGRHLISSNSEFQQSALALLCCCAREGHVDATIYMTHRFLRTERGLGTAGRSSRRPLSSPEGEYLLKSLVNIANSGNFRAMALRGLLASHQGYTKAALNHFKEALPGAMAFSKRKIDQKKTPFLASQQHDELSSPWNELAQTAWKARNELAETDSKAKELKELEDEAFKVGAELDDPNTLYLKAVLERQRYAEKLLDKHEKKYGQTDTSEGDMLLQTPYSFSWLHDMTKAAASGHVDAALEMAQYYANSPAPPTSHDSDQTMSPFKLAVQLWKAFDPVPPRADSRQNMEYYASLVQSPQDRMQMAMYWLRVCTSYGYVPALVSLAKIHISKYIFSKNNLYLPVEHPDAQRKDVHKEDQQVKGMEDGIDNPYYSPRMAHDCLALILELTTTIEEASTERVAAKKRNNAEWIQRLGLAQSFPEVVVDMESSIPRYQDEAYEIADECGIDIQDCRGAVRYDHRGERGHGVFEFGVVEVVTGFPSEYIPGDQESIEGYWKEMRADTRSTEAAGGTIYPS